MLALKAASRSLRWSVVNLLGNHELLLILGDETYARAMHSTVTFRNTLIMYAHASDDARARYVAPFPQCIFVTSTQVRAQPARLPADSLCRFKYAWRPQFHCASASCRHVLPRVASNAAHDGDGNAVLLLPPIQSAGPFCCWPLFPPNVWPHARPHVTHW
jgi:hypothetical protein